MPGIELGGKYSVFAEGARGQLGRQLIERFGLAEGRGQMRRWSSLLQ
ncbi:hypothetical protein [Variovorax sp. MHTC-1]|nr:hypothetical protein [Variovorax sp. MHTC-1]